MAKTPTRSKLLLYCSFCGKSQHDVVKLIAGPNTFICNECCDLAAMICLEDEQKGLLPKVRKSLGALAEQNRSLEELGLRPKFHSRNFTNKPNHAFFLCPFKEPFDTIYNDHIKRAVKEMGYSINRADELFGTQPIIEDIWEQINSTTIVIADLTGRNPNVMYEVGMAHTIGVPTLIITQNIDDVPFDLKHHRCVIYAHTPRGCSDLEERIKGTLRFLQPQKSMSS